MNNPVYDMRVGKLLTRIQAAVKQQMPLHNGSWFMEANALRAVLTAMDLDDEVVQYILTTWKPLFEQVISLNVVDPFELTRHRLTSKGTLTPSTTYVTYSDMITSGIESIHKIVILLLGDGSAELPCLLDQKALVMMQANLDHPSTLFFAYLNATSRPE